MTQRTLIILKPDAVQRQLVGRIIARFEDKGLKIVAARFMRISPELAGRHYAVHKGKPFFQAAVDYLSAAPVLVMVLEGDSVIAMSRRLMGKTFGTEADPGTIRGDFAGPKGYNIVHGSDSPETAAYEIPLYFADDEILSYDLTVQPWF
jgi:nucleoside-diphosphate kinase